MDKTDKSQDVTEGKPVEEALWESEERYRMLVETMNDGLAIQDESGLINYVNDKFCEMMGYSRDEIIGHPTTNLLDETNQKILKEQMAIRHKGEHYSYEIALTGEDGRRIFTIMSPKPILGADGRFKGSFAVITNITERKCAEDALQQAYEDLERRIEERTAELVKVNEKLQADITVRKRIEKALQESEEKLRSTISSMDDLVFVLDKDGIFLDYYQPPSKPELYVPPEVFIGKSFKEVLPPHVVKSMGAAINAVAAVDTVQQFDYPMQVADEELWFNAKVSARKDSLGKFNGATAVVRDITARKRAEEELRKAHDELERRVWERTKELEKSNQELKEATVQLVQSEKMSALGELTAGVAHELNQPLNGIKIICQSILRDIQRDRFEEEELEEDLNDVVLQVNKMAEIIDHMRVYTRSTEGAPEEAIDVNSVIEGAFKFVGQQLRNHNIDVVRELREDLPPIIGDAIRLEQVFLNLITNARNAVESSQKEHKNIQIRTYQNGNLQSASDNPAVVVEVTDNGVGIPEDVKPKIFQPFFTTKEPGKGTGLGLSVASKIIEEHNGRIEVDSQVGERTTFRVILPNADTGG